MAEAFVNLSAARKDLLSKLRFRHPDPCYLIITPHGFALVVTTMMGTLERMNRGYRTDTVMSLRDAGLIKIGESRVTVPEFGYRKPGDLSSGFLARIAL